MERAQMLSHFLQLAGDDHDRLLDAGGKAAIGLHGEHGLAIAHEFDRHTVKVEADISTSKAVTLKGCLEAFERCNIILANLGNMLDSGE